VWRQEEDVAGSRVLERGSQEGQEAREEFLLAGWHIGCCHCYWGLQVHLRYLVSRSLRVISRAGQGRDLVRAFPGYPIKLAEEEGLVVESGAF